MPRKLPVQKRLGARLKALRAESGMSQMDLVRDHGWTLSHYQKLERGVLDCRLTTLEALAASFEVSLADLLEDV